MIVVMMVVVVTVNHRAVIVVGQRSALVFTCEGEEEVLDEVYLVVSQLDTCLVESHVRDSLFESVACTVVVVWPCVLDVAEARHLETVTVTLLLCLLETAVILDCEFLSPFCKVMSAKSHELVRKTTEVVSDMACSAVILLEEFVSGKLICCDSLVIATEPLVET